jgi:hypothetical protein
LYFPNPKTVVVFPKSRLPVCPYKTDTFFKKNSKVAVARYLERDGMSEEDLRAVEMEASAFRASEMAIAAPVFFEPREPRTARAAAAKKGLKDLSSDDELSDLLASDDGEYESESEEPLDKIEKIIYCCQAKDVDDGELLEFGTEDAQKTAADVKRKAKVAKGKPVWLFCVKWDGCGYRRRSWETAADVKAAYKADSKLQSFMRRHLKDPDATTNPFHGDYLVVDRVIDVREALVEEEDPETDDAAKKHTPLKGTPVKVKDAKETKKGKKATKATKKGKKASKKDVVESDSEDSDSDDEATTLQYLVKWRGLGYSEATWEASDSLQSEPDKLCVDAFELRDDLKEKKKTYAGAIERGRAGDKPTAKPSLPEFKNGMALREYQVTSFEWMVRPCAFPKS